MLNSNWKPKEVLQYSLTGVGVAIAVGAFELLLAAAFGAAGLLLGSLALAVVIVLALRRLRAGGRLAEMRVPVQELSLNPFPLWARTWRTPANLAGGTVVAILLIRLAMALLIAGWPVWAVVALDVAVVVISVLGMLAFYYSAYFLMSLFTRRAGGELGVAAWLMTKRRYEEALSWCRRYTNRRPNDPAGWIASCHAFWNLGRLEDAVEDANRAVELRGGDYAKMLRGILYCTFGLHAEAVEDLTANPHRKETLLYLGNSLCCLRRLDEAIAALLEAAGQSSRADEFLQLGEAYRLRGSMAEATVAYALATELARAGKTISAKPGATLAYCLVRTGGTDEAEDVAEAALRDDPKDAITLHALALVANARVDADGARDFIARMIAARPDSGIWAFRDRDFTPLLEERRFRELMAWAIGGQRQTRSRVLARRAER